VLANDFGSNGGRGGNIHGETPFSHLGLWKERAIPVSNFWS